MTGTRARMSEARKKACAARGGFHVPPELKSYYNKLVRVLGTEEARKEIARQVAAPASKAAAE